MAHYVKTPMKWRNFTAVQPIVYTYAARQNRLNVISLRRDFNIAILGAIPYNPTVVASDGKQHGFMMTPVTIISQPFNGVLTINWNTVDLDYQPDPGYLGPDCFIIALFSQETQQSQYFKFLVQVGPVSTEQIITPPPSEVPALSLSLEDQQLYVVEPFSYTIPEGTFYIPLGQTPVYSAYTTGGDPLPDWISFDVGTLTFTGRPPPEASGAVPIFVKVVTSGGNAVDQFYIIVSEVPILIEWACLETGGHWENSVCIPIGPTQREYAVWDPTSIEVDGYRNTFFIGEVGSINFARSDKLLPTTGKRAWEFETPLSQPRFGLVNALFVDTSPMLSDIEFGDNGLTCYVNEQLSQIFVYVNGGEVAASVSNNSQHFNLPPNTNVNTQDQNRVLLGMTYDADTGEVEIYINKIRVEFGSPITISNGVQYRPVIKTVDSQYKNKGNFGIYAMRSNFPSGVPHGIYDVVPAGSFVAADSRTVEYTEWYSDQASCQSAGFAWDGNQCFDVDRSSGVPRNETHLIKSEPWCLANGGSWSNGFCWTPTLKNNCVWDAKLDTIIQNLPWMGTAQTIDQYTPKTSQYEIPDTTQQRMVGISADLFNAQGDFEVNFLDVKLAMEQHLNNNVPLGYTYWGQWDQTPEYGPPYVLSVDIVSDSTHLLADEETYDSNNARLCAVDPNTAMVEVDGLLSDPNRTSEKIFEAVTDMLWVTDLGEAPQSRYPVGYNVKLWIEEIEPFRCAGDPTLFEHFFIDQLPTVLPSLTFSLASSIGDANLVLQTSSQNQSTFPIYNTAGNKWESSIVLDVTGRSGKELFKTYLQELYHALGLSHDNVALDHDYISMMDYSSGTDYPTYVDTIALRVAYDARLMTNMVDRTEGSHYLLQGNKLAMQPYFGTYPLQTERSMFRITNRFNAVPITSNTSVPEDPSGYFVLNKQMPARDIPSSVGISANPAHYTGARLVVIFARNKIVSDPGNIDALSKMGDVDTDCP